MIMLKFSIIAAGITPAAAKQRQSPPDAAHAHDSSSGQKPRFNSAPKPVFASAPEIACSQRTLLHDTNPGQLKLWMSSKDAFTESELQNLIIWNQLPTGSVIMIKDDGRLTACRITTDASGQNYEVLANNRCKIDQGSTLILNRPDPLKAERTS